MTIYSTYLEVKEKSEFIEFCESDNKLNVRTGLIGKPCLVLNVSFNTPGKGKLAYDRLVRKWRSSGFDECSRTTPVIEGSFVDELYCDEHPQNPLLETFFSINGAEASRGTHHRLAFFRSGLRWQGDFDFERVASLELHTGVIVAGDIEVSGVLSQLTSTYPTEILVAGNIRAASLGHRDSQMRVTGDVHVDNIIYGEYNDGSLHIDGSAHGRAWISADHDMYAAGGHHLPVCDLDSGDNWIDCLHPELFEIVDGEPCEFGSLSDDAIRAFMREGRDPLRPGAKPSAQQKFGEASQL